LRVSVSPLFFSGASGPPILQCNEHVIYGTSEHKSQCELTLSPNEVREPKGLLIVLTL